MNSLPKTVTRQRRNCNLNPVPTAPESSTLTTRLPSYVENFTYFFESCTFPNFYSLLHYQQMLFISQQSQGLVLYCLLL